MHNKEALRHCAGTSKRLRLSGILHGCFSHTDRSGKCHCLHSVSPGCHRETENFSVPPACMYIVFYPVELWVCVEIYRYNKGQPLIPPLPPQLYKKSDGTWAQQNDRPVLIQLRVPCRHQPLYFSGFPVALPDRPCASAVNNERYS